MDIDKYLRICEELGEEPDPQKMPPDPSEFPEEVQVAFFISEMLEDNWEGMSGTYMGKLYHNLEYLFDLYEVENRKTVLFFIRMLEVTIVNYKAEESDRKRKAEERQSSGGGKKYTHNVKG